MAKKDNNIPKKKNPTGFKTKGSNSGNRTNSAPIVSNSHGGAIINKRKAIIISVVATVLVIALALGIFFGFFAGKRRFDYIKRDLSKYITLSESDYKNIKVDVPLYEFEEYMIDRAITDLLVANKAENPLYDGTGVKNLAITIGDVVTLRFRGYTKDENGKETDISSLMNLTADNDATLEIGAYENLVGLNEAIVGIIPNDVTTFEKIETGVVGAGDVVYVSYSGSKPETAPQTVKMERIDLSRPDLEEVYGTGFKEALIGQEIGNSQSMVTLSLPGGGTAMYIDLKVDFLTRCENDPFVVEATYPPDYEEVKELRGKTVFFDIYIKNAVIYDTPEYNEEFIEKTLKLTDDDLSKYKGANRIEKHREYIREELLAGIESTNEQIIAGAIWEHLADKGKVIKYPKSEVEGYYNSMLANVYAYFQQNGSTYETIDSAAIAYYRLESGADWQAHIRSLAELEVRDKLIFYYIFKEEGFTPTEEEYNAKYNEIVEHEVSLMINEHAEELEGLEGEEYDAQVDLLRQELLDYLGEDGMRELIYFEVGTRKMAKYLAVIE